MASTGDAEHDSTPFMDDAELRDFANRHGVPPEVLLALPGPVVRGDCEAATWVYLKAHGLSEANVGRPSQIDAFKLEAGIRRRVLSARREIGIGDAGSLGQTTQILNDRSASTRSSFRNGRPCSALTPHSSRNSLFRDGKGNGRTVEWKRRMTCDDTWKFNWLTCDGSANAGSVRSYWRSTPRLLPFATRYLC